MTTPTPPHSPIDPLEQELQALTPRPISPNLIPGMHAHLARTRLVNLATLACAAAAAACIALFITLHSRTAPPSPPIKNIAESSVPLLPSVAYYRQALARSPDSIDAILSQPPAPEHALQPDPRPDSLMQSLAKY